MQFRAKPVRLAARALPLCLAIACAAPAAAVAVELPGKDGGPLSPPLAELARPAVATRAPAVQADLLGVPRSGPGSLIREAGKVRVNVRLDPSAPLPSAALSAAGAEIVSSSPSTASATVAIAPAQLPALAAVPGVLSVWQAREPIVRAVGGPCEGGAAISEGLGQLRVGEAREALQLRGEGTTIGVLSDSYDTARTGAEPPPTTTQDDEASNDLPGPAGSCFDQRLPVAVLDEGPGGASDEGRAMLQIVHDLAPRASLAFATAFQSEESFARNIERLAEPAGAGGGGAEVIVDDVSYFEEPFFQDGPVAVAVNRVTAAGVSYFSAAGNDNLFDAAGNEIASWEAPQFRNSGSCPATIAVLPDVNGTNCMDFDPGAGSDATFGIAVEPGATLTLDLQWAEPWNGVGTDLDAFLLSGTGTILAESEEDNASPSGTQRPVEIIQWENASGSARTVRLAINRFSGGSPRLKFVFLQSGVSATEYPESSGGDIVGPAIYGHSGAASAIATAAVPFSNRNTIESYSSRGPATHYYGPVEGFLPAPPLGTPEVLAKPDLAATDCTANTFFGFLAGGTWRFCGTSAAAPHAAAVAALMRQARPTFGQQQVREALTATADPVGALPPEAAGAGLVDAFDAIANLPVPVPPTGPPVQVAMPPAATAPTVTPPRPTPSLPSTTIRKAPAKVVRTRGPSVRLVFRFGSNQAGARFLCKIDRARYRPCSRRFARRYALGRHVLKVKARGAGGLVDPTPARYRFRVVAVS